MNSKALWRLQASLFQSLSKLTDANEQVLMESAQNILVQTLKEVPEKTGTLKSIAGISETRQSATRISIRVGYGVNGDAINPDTGRMASEYMMAVHEDLFAIHSKGKAKFFEDPVNQERARIMDKLRAAARKVKK